MSRKSREGSCNGEAKEQDVNVVDGLHLKLVALRLHHSKGHHPASNTSHRPAPGPDLALEGVDEGGLAHLARPHHRHPALN